MTQQLVFTVEVDEPTIDLRPLLEPPSLLRAYVTFGGCLLWKHKGAARLYPTNLLTNLIGLHDDYAAMKESGRISEMPPSSYTIHWDGFQPSSKEGDEGFDGGDAT